MTEKEFMELVALNTGIDTTKASIILEIVKRQGAKFDPEPVILPELKIHLNSNTYTYEIIASSPQLLPSGMTYYFTRGQAEEIVRRCNLKSTEKGGP